MSGRALFLGFAVLSAATLAAGCSGPSGPIDGERAYAHVERFVEIGPRPFGSENLAKTADYITGELTAMGLEPKRHEPFHEKEKKTIRNLWVEFDGPDPEKGPILIIGGHYDTKLAMGHDDEAHNFQFVGAIDGGGAPAVLIELARHLKDPENRPPVNVWLYWIDAEESIDWNWNDERALLGSKAFCRMLHEEKILPRVKAFVLLDLIGDKNLKIDRDGNSNPRLLDIFEKAAEKIGERDRLFEFPTAEEIAYAKQQGIPWGTKDDHTVFNNFGVRSVLLIDFARRLPGENQRVDDRYTRWWHTPDDDLSQVSPDSLAIAGNLVVAALPDLADFCLGKKRPAGKK